MADLITGIFCFGFLWYVVHINKQLEQMKTRQRISNMYAGWDLARAKHDDAMKEIHRVR